MRIPARVLALLLLIPACSGEDEPVVIEARALGPDFDVPAGAMLVGDRFPGAQAGAWTAVMLTGDDPLAVLEDLMAQADARGLGIEAGGVTMCDVTASVLDCQVLAGRADPDRSYSIALTWGRDSGASYRHVVIEAWPSPPHWSTGPTVAVVATLPSPPDPIEAWAEPAVGEPVAVVPAWFDEPIARRAPGTRVLAPSAPASCATGGYNAVLAVDDEVETAVDAYARQFDDLGFEGGTDRGTFEGQQFVAARYHSAGDGSFDAVGMVSPDGESGTLLLARCND